MDQEGATVQVLDIPISRMDLEQALSSCRKLISEGRGGYFCFANVHTVTEARYHSEVRHAMTGATSVFADGVPLSWVARMKGEPVGSRVSGPDFMQAFLARFAEVDQAFLGGAPGVSARLISRFNLEAVAYSPPMRDFAPPNVEDDLAKLKAASKSGALPPVVWVGLGAPKQELWMECAHRIAPATLFFGVGAAFDFLGGTKVRAPRWMQRCGLEWFYRLAQEPSRLFGRYLRTNLGFGVELLKDALKRPS